MAQAINAPQKALLVRPSIRRSSCTGTHSRPISLNHSLTSPIVSGRHWMIAMCGSPSLGLKSRTDALQRTFPTMGRNPIERGGLNSCARLAGRAGRVDQVRLVYLVCLVCLVCLVEPERPDEPDGPDRPDNDLARAVFLDSVYRDAWKPPQAGLCQRWNTGTGPQTNTADSRRA